MNWQPIGQILQELGVDADSVELALVQQLQSGKRLGEILLTMQAVSSAQLAEALARQADLPFTTCITELAEAKLLQSIPIGYAKDYRILPLTRTDEGVKLVVADPYDNRPLNDLATLTGGPLILTVAPGDEILRAINRSYERQAGTTNDLSEDIGENDQDGMANGLEPADLLDTNDEAPIIRFVNSLVTQAYKQRASDIHIEPFETELVIRYRIDGLLYDALRPPQKAQAGITSRIKIMANLNIAEKRLPQDGRFRVRIAGKDLDVRVSTLPTAFGERVVLRLLDQAAGVLSLEEIGIPAPLLSSIDALIHKNHGIFLVTGPTGSGKTTTLYAALTRLNSRDRNIITVEDPIEYQLNGVGQIQVNPKINLTFAAGLRSILRQDPDIIMVGEIRDSETAEIAVQSALTGHMVFSTLHTNGAAGALTRLVEMGIEPFLAASSIGGILAQRLVRRICPDCRRPYSPSAKLLKEAGLIQYLPPDAVFYRGEGCEACLGTGYRGRTGIFELLTVDDTIRELLLQNKDATTIKQAAMRAGMQPLREAGLAEALAGKTSLEEVLRVTQEEN